MRPFRIVIAVMPLVVAPRLALAAADPPAAGSPSAADAEPSSAEPAPSSSVTRSPSTSPSPAVRTSGSTDPGTGAGHRSGARGAPAVAAEAGLFVGAFLPARNHNLQDEARVHRQLAPAAVDLGARVGATAVGILGVEAEGALVGTESTDGRGATLWAVRGQGVLSLPAGRVVPFLVVGGGALGILSASLGDDVDPAVHAGVGARYAVRDRVILRLDLRDNLTQRDNAAQGVQAQHFEVLVGLSIRAAGRSVVRSPPVPPDTDADGILDGADACPVQAGLAPDGCPLPDTDRDGVVDAVDRCPRERGGTPFGCPAVDRDGDGFFDDSDPCPDSAGTGAGPCPEPSPPPTTAGPPPDGPAAAGRAPAEDAPADATTPPLDLGAPPPRGAATDADGAVAPDDISASP